MPTGGLDVDTYLERIGFDGPINHDVDTIERLQIAHLSTVPFENLHVFHRLGVRTDIAWSVPKIVERRLGGWCFENNGAFAALLDGLGFEVRLLGAAVLLGGPTDVIDHLTLEVQAAGSWLVDVGFGDSFIKPLDLNRRGPQDGGTGTFELMPSPKGLTLTVLDDDVPAAQYRFKRVSLELADFDPASQKLQTNETGQWLLKRFATRLIDDGPNRVTLLTDRLKLKIDGETTETAVPAERWDDVLSEWFGMRVPG